MIALYKVPEPDPPGLSGALAPEVSQQLWKITLHNFTPDLDFPWTPRAWGTLRNTEFELVVLAHRPQYDPKASPSTALPNFVHPPNAVYMIGPDSRNWVIEDIPQHLQKLRRHNVHIPTDSLHPMWGHTVWAVVYWDRMMKA